MASWTGVIASSLSATSGSFGCVNSPVALSTSARFEVGTEAFAVTAEDVTGEQRDRLYAQQAAFDTSFADYEKKTGPLIPVVALSRVR